MKKILAFLLSALSLFAQDAFLPSFDYAIFSYDDTSSYLEFYYSFPANEMKKNNRDDVIILNGQLDLKIERNDATKEIYYNNTWKFESKYHEKEQSELNGLISIQIPDGKYLVYSKGIDLNSGLESDVQTFELNIDAPSNETFSMSDLEIASSITQYSQNTNSIFYKNTMEIIPNPRLVFGNGLPVLYFYCELYNLDKSVESKVLKLDHILSNNRGEIVYTKSKLIGRSLSSRVEIGAINIMDYPSGGYSLDVVLSDTVSQIKELSSRKIFVYNPEILDTAGVYASSEDILATEFALMDESEIDFVFDYSKYIATQSEKDSWDDLKTLDGKRNFVYQFWKKRDRVPSTSQNETRIEYLERLHYVNDQFGNIVIKDGYKTDMGRVYMMFGKPDDISRYPNESEKVPYEIWQYNYIESGVQFVFADFNSLGNYRQIHSNKKGELQNRFWEQQILIDNPDYFSR